MQDDKKIDFDFDDDFEDISSSTKRESERFDDIVSDSSKKYNNSHTPSNSDYYVGEHSRYKKKKHGIGRFFENMSYQIKRRWVRMKKGKRRFLTTFLIVVLILCSAVIWFFNYFDYNYNGITEDPDDLGFENTIDKDVVNIALFGIDSRETSGKTSFNGNSDSIMILSINNVTKKIKIISLMRDTLVPIERDKGLTYYKLNAAYSWGGPELAIKTLNQNFGLDISEYATVNFYGMSDIIDAVGGIDATLTKSEVTARGENNHGINDMIQEICSYEKLNPNDYYINVSGEQHLNGIQAVAYARIRYCTNIWGTSNDFGRTDRQRYVMEQLFNKAKTLSKKDYIKLAKALIPCTETSLSYSQIMGLAFSVMLHSPTFEQYRIPQITPEMDFLMTSPSGSFGSVIYFDLNYASKVIKAIIYDDMTIEQYVEQYGIEKNDWYAKRNGSSGNKYPSSSSSTQKKPSVTETPSSSKTSDTSEDSPSSVTSSGSSSSTIGDNDDYYTDDDGTDDDDTSSASGGDSLEYDIDSDGDFSDE